jgi:cobalamin biosynthetic protein CobC
VSALPPEHGGRLALARARFPDAPRPFIDLSTGINPVPYPVPALPPEAFVRLPEPEDIAALEAAASRAYGVADPGMVVAAPGTQLLISLLPHLWPQRRVAVVAPTYSEHALGWRAAGADVAEVAAPEAGTAADALVLCNPNNPDGRRWPAATLRPLAVALAGRGGLLVADEAFADLEDEPLSLAPLLPHPAIVVLRSFGKTYGLAGLRLGFALASPERAAAIRAALGPWAVSGPAIAIARRALADTFWLAATRARLRDDAARLDDVLHAAGLAVCGGTRLFRLADTHDAAGVWARLGRAGILARAFAHTPRWLRFGMPGNDVARERLAAALRPS